MVVMGFIIGFLFGGMVGFAITALCIVGSQADREAERYHNNNNEEE